VKGALKIPDKLKDIKTLNLATDTLVIVLTEQLNAAKAKLITAENEIIAQKSQINQTDTGTFKMKREIESLNEQNSMLIKEI
jgi:hypothetical protein